MSNKYLKESKVYLKPYLCYNENINKSRFHVKGVAMPAYIITFYIFVNIHIFIYTCDCLLINIQ